MAILDGHSPTGAWSMSRNLLDAWVSSLYTESGGSVSSLHDQAGGGFDFNQGTSSAQPALSSGGPNGRECLDFDGSNDYLQTLASNNFFANNAAYMVASFIPVAITKTSSTFYNNHAVVGDSNGYMGIYAGGPGGSPYPVTAYNYDGNADYASEAALVIDELYVVELKHEAGNISVRVNGGTWTSVASGNTTSQTSGFRMGRGYGSSYFNMKLFELATFSTIPSALDQDAIAADFYDWQTTGGTSQPVSITQAPLLVVDLTNQPVHVTQVPILAISLPFQPARITQAPILVPNHPTPVPLPLPIIPEVPVTETWNYNTVINIADLAKEQRSSLRPHPRVGMSFTAYTLDEDDHRDLYQMLFKYIKQEFYYPHYVYSTKMQAAAAVNSTKLFFNPAHTDMRVGEPVAFVDPQTHETVLSTTIDTASLAPRVIKVTSVDMDGVTFSEPLSFEVPAHWMVCPASDFRFRMRPGFSMQSISGEVKLDIETTDSRDVVRPGQNVVLPTIDGIVILDKRPLANTSVDDNFDQNVTWLDNDINKAEPRTLWPTPYIGGAREFLAHRPTDIDFWREFADTIRGRWKPFILATYRDDLPLVAVPALSATVLVSSNVQFFDFWRSKAYQYIRIERPNGYIYRRINEVTMNYSAGGAPESINIELNSSIGGSAGDNDITKVSFANTCRLDDDVIKLDHYEVDTFVSMTVRTIDA